MPLEVAPQGFQSQLVRCYQRDSQATQRLFARLYLEGLATGDFKPVFRELVGETTAMSANTVVRLKGAGRRSTKRDAGGVNHMRFRFVSWLRSVTEELSKSGRYEKGVYLLNKRYTNCLQTVHKRIPGDITTYSQVDPISRFIRFFGEPDAIWSRLAKVRWSRLSRQTMEHRLAQHVRLGPAIAKILDELDAAGPALTLGRAPGWIGTSIEAISS